MEEKLGRERKRGRLRAFARRLREKRRLRKEKKSLQKEAMTSEEKIEAEAWENSKAELFVLFMSVLITSLMMLSAFNKIFLWHHMSTWNPMWVQWGCGLYIMLGLGVFWHRGAEWVGLNLLNVYLGFWSFILFIPYDPATELTLFDEKGVIGIMPWILSLAAFLLLIIFRGYSWWLNLSSFSLGFLVGLLLWLAALYWWQIVDTNALP